VRDEASSIQTVQCFVEKEQFFHLLGGDMPLVEAHKRLRVWQEAMTLVKTVYAFTENFPGAEKYGLISQMRVHQSPYRQTLQKVRLDMEIKKRFNST
jgi:hypothetical protein